MIAGLILAAGESSRMGRDKALLPYRGRTFLETIISTLREAGIARIAVVLGHHADEIQKHLKFEGIEIVINPDYRLGQTSSLQAGLRAVAAVSPIAGVRGTPSESRDRTPPPPLALERDGEDAAATEAELEAIVLCLVDHPAVSAETVRALTDSFKESPAAVIIPTHHGQHGHPVMIARTLFPELLKLSQGAGANVVIRKYRDTTQFVEVDDRGILLDVDNPEIYNQLQAAPEN